MSKETDPVVKLTIYEWHLVLSELEHMMRFVNVDIVVAKSLYHKISQQLNEKSV